ncbi:hypothetical protein FDECE_11064 [Fusarium decemcellulare]|nr:hypothetical protein FDECE_11064 [Fusarium decemcellulare]
MDSSSLTTSPFGPFAFAEAGRAFFQCIPDIERLLSTDEQPSLDLKYLRLAHSVIQDAFETGQNHETSLRPIPERELGLYLEAIRDCTTTTEHLRHQSNSDVPGYAQIHQELVRSLREARICSEQLQYHFQKSCRFSRYLLVHVDQEAFAQWLRHPSLRNQETNQWQNYENEFLDILITSNAKEIEKQSVVWFKRKGLLVTDRKLRKHLRKRIAHTARNVAAVLAPSPRLELIDCLCDLLWQTVTSSKQELSVVCKCWFLSHKNTRPLLEDVERMLHQEVRRRCSESLILDVDQCYDHLENIFPKLQGILKTGCRIFLVSWRPVPGWLNKASIARVTYYEHRYLSRPCSSDTGVFKLCAPPRSHFNASSLPSHSSTLTHRPSRSGELTDLVLRTTHIIPLAEEVRNNMLHSLARDTSPNSRVSLNVLVWMVFGFQRLTHQEIQAAIGNDIEYLPAASNADPDDALELSAHLDLLFSVGNSIRDRSEVGLFQSKLLEIEEMPTGGPHALLTEQCLSYIRTTCNTGPPPNTTEELTQWLYRFPLLEYAGRHWGEHVEKIETLSSQLLDSITEFLESRHLEELAAILLSNAGRDSTPYKGAYKSMTGLHLASAFGLVKVVPQMLHSRKFTPYLRTEGGWTALHWATLSRKEEMVSFLLSLPDSTTLLSLTTSVERWTALHLAAKQGYLSLAKILATDKNIIDQKDRWGRTALYLACWGGNAAIVEELLSQGANPNIDNLYGTTLHCAVKRREAYLVRTLIRATSSPLDLDIRNPIQLTALEEAQNRGLDDIAAILLDAGAKSGLTLECASQQRTVQTFALDAASTFHWRCYEIDPDRSCQVRNGKQCKGDVLRLIQQEATGAPDEAKAQPQSGDSDGKSVMPRYAFRKTFDIADDAHGKIQKYLLSEWQILSKLDHPHIARYIDSDEDPNRNEFLLYTEYCDHGDLALHHGLSLGILQTGDNKKYGFADGTAMQDSETRPLTGVEMWAMIWQLASALAYLHYGLSVKRKDDTCIAFFEDFWSYVIHRDVKPANVVLQSTEDGKYIFKLCDLGIATDAGKGPEQNKTQFGGSPGFQPPNLGSEARRALDNEGRRFFTWGIETIRSTFKVRDEMLDCKAFRDFLDSARQADCDSRIDSLTVMEVAYKNLRPIPFRTLKLPKLVVEEMSATHRLLRRGEGGYLVQAFVCTAQLLDIPDLFGDDSTKAKRTSVVNRLWLLLDDGAEETCCDREDMSKVHLLVLLNGRKKLEKASRLRQLDETLKSGFDVNFQWPHSGWTALHLAAQEGKLEAVQKLLHHGAKTNVKDKHGKTAMDYAGDKGCTEVVALLAPSGLAETVNAFHPTSFVERSSE